MSRILNSNPLFFKTSKELCDKYVKGKFEVLEKTTSENDYYDYIFAIGALGYWCASEAGTNNYYN